jgi:hypothetical protein
MFHLSFFGSVIEVAEFEDEFFFWGGEGENVTHKKYQKEALELTKILRPRMQRSHQNTSVLILTCLIRRSDESQMSNLISVVEYFRFSPF